MYIRRTQTRNTASGERYYTYRLVESKRVEGKVKQITRLNLGRHFDVGQDHWPALCARIEELLQGQAPLVPVCQWPIILTPFRPIKLTHLGRQKSALAFVLQSIALSSQHEDV